ncbi:hypothetical protein Lesp02_74810 [Lentzea sp. NBRC 105346]|uniref:RNA polymerase sigma factor n=1 Tax=Lentzea sp. NBRC 105346 TaxID=3032205 RepID=UPI0024A4068F|nr:sigma factor [Lentzea sp. NBRC 105346]GLZ35294.1 hypothetical protein Lesp02_74810 [Lentzea sp. NBRC 105346]
MTFDEMVRRVAADLDERYADYDLGAAREDVERRVSASERTRTTFDNFVIAQLPSLLAYATSLTGDRHLAEDLVQDVLLRALEHWDRIGGVDAADYVERLMAASYLSPRQRQAAHDTDASESESLDILLRRMAHLSDEQRAAIMLGLDAAVRSHRPGFRATIRLGESASRADLP